MSEPDEQEQDEAKKTRKFGPLDPDYELSEEHAWRQEREREMRRQDPEAFA